MKLKDSFHPYAMLTTIFWSLAYVYTRLALQHFSALPLAFLRYLLAASMLIVTVVLLRIPLPARRDWLWFVASGATGFFGYVTTFNLGAVSVTASTSSVVISTTPVFTALLARIFLRERLRFMQWFAIVVAFAGILVLTLMNGIFSINVGIFWLLLAALIMSVYNLLQRKLTKQYPGLQISAYSMFAGTLMLIPFAPASYGEVMTAPPVQLFYVALLGVFPSAAAYVLWTKAFEKAENTSSVSNYMFLTPFLATLLGFMIAKETPDVSTLIGGTMILLGLLMFNLGSSRQIQDRK